MTKKKILLTRPQRVRAEEFVRSNLTAPHCRASAAAGLGSRATPPPSAEGVGAGVWAGAGGGAQPRVRVRAKEENFKESKEDLGDLVRGMSAKDRKELLDRLLLAQEADRGVDRDADMWAEAVYEALVRAAGRASGTIPGPAVIRSLVSARKAWEPVRGLMESSGMQELKVTERRSVYGLLARLVVQDARDFCEWSKAPMGPKIVAQRCEHVAATVDRSFPGYLASGLMPIVAERLLAGGAEVAP